MKSYCGDSKLKSNGVTLMSPKNVVFMSFCPKLFVDIVRLSTSLYLCYTNLIDY